MLFMVNVSAVTEGHVPEEQLNKLIEQRLQEAELNRPYESLITLEVVSAARVSDAIGLGILMALEKEL